jgi:transcriptional regulator with XRE-family HTH domain
MKATPQLRAWVTSRMKEAGMNASALAEETKVTHATWSRFLNRKHRNLSPASVAALCRLFHVSELDLYRIAHGIPIPTPEIQAFTDWLESQPAPTLAAVLRAATRHGWQSPSNQPRKPLQGNGR